MVNQLIQTLRQHRIATAVSATLLLVAGYVGWNLFGPQSDPRLEAVRKEGYPTTLKELNASYPAVPADENVALACEYLFPKLAGIQPLGNHFRERTSFLSQRREISPEGKTFLAGILATNQEALELLHALPATNRSRYSIDLTQGSSTLLPHLAKVKEAALLLVAEAVFLNGNGQLDQAIESLAIAGRVADTLAREPVLISYLVRIASWQAILTGLEQILSSATLTDRQLVSLQALFQSAEKSQDLGRVLASERAFGLSIFDDEREQTRLFANNGGPSQANLPQLAFGLFKASGLFRRDRAFYLDSMASQVGAARLPFPERFRRGQAAANLVVTNITSHRLSIISRMMLPALGRAFTKDAESAARLRAAQAALAVERFRLAHAGALPERLERLAPDLLKTVPPDPFDGAPLRFKKLDSGFVVYSVGADLQDDGGSEPPPGKSAKAKDVTFTVER